MKYEVKSLDNKSAGEVNLSDSIFALPVRSDILARMVNWQLAKRRAGTHQTKTISMISGTTKKPFKQKGTGNARQGSMRSPQFRGGATIFGPVVRSHEHQLPKKVRTLALKTALSSKVKSGQLIVVDSLKLNSAKAKDFSKTVDGLGLKSALFIDGAALDASFALAYRNIKGMDALPVQGINVYDILNHEHLVLTKEAVEALEGRLK